MTTVYLKIKAKGKPSRIEQREAWDVDKFLSSVIESYAKDKDAPAKVALGTRAEYLEQIKRK